MMYGSLMVSYAISIMLLLSAVAWSLRLHFDDEFRGYHIFTGSLGGVYAFVIALAICGVGTFIVTKPKMTKMEQTALTDFQDATNNKEITGIEFDPGIKLLESRNVLDKDEIVVHYIDDNENECTERFYHVPYNKKESTDGQYRVEITDKKAILYIPKK